MRRERAMKALVAAAAAMSVESGHEASLPANSDRISAIATPSCDPCCAESCASLSLCNLHVTPARLGPAVRSSRFGLGPEVGATRFGLRPGTGAIPPVVTEHSGRLWRAPTWIFFCHGGVHGLPPRQRPLHHCLIAWKHKFIYGQQCFSVPFGYFRILPGYCPWEYHWEFVLKFLS